MSIFRWEETILKSCKYLRVKHFSVPIPVSFNRIEAQQIVGAATNKETCAQIKILVLEFTSFVGVCV